MIEEMDRAKLSDSRVLGSSPHVPSCFENLVLQGGGIRCFWQAGFLSRVSKEMPLHPRDIFSVSAAAGIACAFVAKRLEFSIECFKLATSRNPRNWYPGRVFSRQSIFPHAAIYRELLQDVFAGEALSVLKQGPEVQVLLCRPSARCPSAAVLPLAALLIAVGSRASRGTWERVRRWSGFSAEFVSARSCATSEDVADLVLASSCTPPVTPLFRFGGRPSLDGGLLESVPRSALREERGPALIMLTKAPPHQGPGRQGDVVVHPSAPIGVSPWDYTRPLAIDELVALGTKDAESFLRSHAP